MRALFAVTYEIVTPESAEHGEADARGYIDRDMTLRDAIGAINATRTKHVGGVESIECDSSGGRPRWVTVTNSAEYLTGAQESRSLHIPPSVSNSSARRIARFLGAV